MKQDSETQLQTACRVYLGKDCSFKDRIELSSGVLKVTEPGSVYAKNAVVPKMPWRAPSKEEYNHISATDPEIPSHHSIGIFRLHSQLIDEIKGLKLDQVSSLKEIELMTTREETRFNDAMTKLESAIKELQVTDVQKEVVGFDVGIPNALTTTIDWARKQKPGLHIDSWDELPMQNLSLARNRICFNFSREARNLLFINLPVDTLFARVSSLTKKKLNEIGKSELCSLFFNNNMEYPVIKLKVEPFEAYIAPTENIIHDGSTRGNSFPDITYTVIGKFAIASPMR